jgi:hypothetical protein
MVKLPPGISAIPAGHLGAEELDIDALSWFTSPVGERLLLQAHKNTMVRTDIDEKWIGLVMARGLVKRLAWAYRVRRSSLAPRSQRELQYKITLPGNVEEMWWQGAALMAWW